MPQIYRHLWPSSQGPVGRTYRVYIYQCLVVYFHYRMRHCREGREHFQNNARCKTNKYVTCFLSTRAKVTRTLGLVRATFPVSDKNARLLKAASLFKWLDITVEKRVMQQIKKLKFQRMFQPALPGTQSRVFSFWVHGSIGPALPAGFPVSVTQ